MDEPTIKYHESDWHSGITYISYAYEKSFLVKDAKTDELLLEVYNGQLEYIEVEEMLDVHSLAEVAKIASDWLREKQVNQ